MVNPIPFQPITLGQTLRTRRLNRFRVADSAYVANQVLRPHVHRHDSMTLVRQGEFRESVDGIEHTCFPGTVLFTPAARSHGNAAGPGGTRSLIVEWTSLHDSCGFGPLQMPDSGLCMSGDSVAELSAAAEREFERGDRAAPVALEGILLQLIACMARGDATPGKRAPPAWLQAVVAHLDQNFLEQIGSVQLAEVAGIHPVHLSRTFRAHMHCTPRDYQQRLRLQFGARMLATTSASVARIAFDAGFSDHAHFSRTFRRHTGQTPTEYRRDHQRR